MQTPTRQNNAAMTHRGYCLQMQPESVVCVLIGDCNLTLLYEVPRKKGTYGCMPADVVRVLELVIAHDAGNLPDLIIFRQPTHKQKQLSPIWGRFVCHVDVAGHSGSAIILESQEIGGVLYWPRKLGLADQEEFRRLKKDDRLNTHLPTGMRVRLRRSCEMREVCHSQKCSTAEKNTAILHTKRARWWTRPLMVSKKIA